MRAVFHKPVTAKPTGSTARPTSLTALTMHIGPFTVGATVNVRTVVANFNAGTVSSATKTAVVV